MFIPSMSLTPGISPLKESEVLSEPSSSTYLTKLLEIK